MYARSTTINAQPSAIDSGVAHLRDEVMPQLQGLDGFVGMSLLTDRESGRCIVVTAWESQDAMNAVAEQVRPIREKATQMFSGGAPTVDEWDIAILHRARQMPEGACARVTWGHVDPAHADASPWRELGALKRGQVWLTLGVGAIGFGGMFAVYAYLASTLQAVTGVGPEVLPWVFAVFGVGMFLGNILGAWAADRIGFPAAGGVLLWSAAALSL